MAQNEGQIIRNVPSELWDIIFVAVRDNNTSPKFERTANIAALLLTCRHFHDIGLPHFYERVCMIGGRGRRSTALLDALERDERKRTSVREIFLARWGDWLQPNHSGPQDALMSASEDFALMERVFTKLSKLQVVYGFQVVVSNRIFGHIFGLATLRELHLHQVSLPKASQIEGMGVSSALVRVLKLLGGDFLTALNGLQAPAFMDTVLHLTMNGSAMFFYNSLRVLDYYPRPKFIKALRLINVFSHSAPGSMFAAIPNLLQDCPDIEELTVDAPLPQMEVMPGLERLKRFRGRFETAISFCKGKPVEAMVLGPFTRVPKVADLIMVICSTSVPLLRIKLWGITWDTGIINTVAEGCPQLEELEVIATQEKSVDPSSVALLINPLIHLQRVRMEGRRILGQAKLEQIALQKSASEKFCPMLREAQFSEGRYWRRNGADCSWTMIKLSVTKPISNQPSVLCAGTELVLY